MQTVVLAAGEGTRMRPLTARRPKPMLPVADQPIVAHTLDAAVEAGADSLVVVVGYEGERIREYVGDTWQGVPVTYAEQPDQRGTADAVRVASEKLTDDPFAVLNGDALYDTESLRAVFDSAPAVGSFEVDDPTQYGVLQLDDASGTVAGIVEKPADPPSAFINTGAYAFPAAAREWLDVEESQRGELELTDVLARVCEEYDVSPVRFDRWLDVGRPWELLEANEWKLGALSRRVDGEVHELAEIQGSVVVEEGATVRSGVVIEGPALIRSGATVGPNAYVRGATLVERGANIGHSVEVKNSVVMEDVSVGHLSYVGDSLLGEGTNFGAGTTVANLRHDDGAIPTTVKGERVSTGRRKFGCVCGPDVKTGINTSLNVGAVLGARETTEPGEVVR